MATKFNSGRGAAVCDWCGAMLVDGGRVVKAHRELRLPDGALRYCTRRCMEEHVDNDAGMHRKRSLALAREVERLRMIYLAKAEGEALARMISTLISRSVEASRDET